MFGGNGVATAAADAEAAAKLQKVKDKVGSACAASELSGREALSVWCSIATAAPGVGLPMQHRGLVGSNQSVLECVVGFLKMVRWLLEDVSGQNMLGAGSLPSPCSRRINTLTACHVVFCCFLQAPLPVLRPPQRPATMVALASLLPPLPSPPSTLLLAAASRFCWPPTLPWRAAITSALAGTL